MTKIDLNLDNYSYANIMADILKGYSNEYEFTKDGIFRRIRPLDCEICGKPMSHNGHNTYSKKNIGAVKIGKYHCVDCGINFDEDKTFWEELKGAFKEGIDDFILKLKMYDLSFEAISDIMTTIFPRSKTYVANVVKEALQVMGDEIYVGVPDGTDYVVVFYDEQCVKVNGEDTFRLTLLNCNGEVIGEELAYELTGDQIFMFLAKYLDHRRPTFIVTDCAITYPKVFESFFDDYIHQLCLFHLNKLIAKAFPRNGTIEDEYMKYRLLNIFYNHEKELDYLRDLLEEQERVKNDSNISHEKWLKKTRWKFRAFVHDLYKARRRRKQNLELHSYEDSGKKLIELIKEYNCLEKKIQKRLKMIASNWDNFTAFHRVENAPATNNRIENFYSRTAKTHRKKHFRADRGVVERLKLAILKINGYFSTRTTPLFSLFFRFLPFQDFG